MLSDSAESESTTSKQRPESLYRSGELNPTWHPPEHEKVHSYQKRSLPLSKVTCVSGLGVIRMDDAAFKRRLYFLIPALAGRPGAMVSKNRRMSSVWRSVPAFARIRAVWVRRRSSDPEPCGGVTSPFPPIIPQERVFRRQ